MQSMMFVILLLLTTVNTHIFWPDAMVSSAPLALVTILLLTLYHLKKNSQFRRKLIEHNRLTLLILGYAALQTISIIANFPELQEAKVSLYWSLTLIVIPLSIPVFFCYFYWGASNQEPPNRYATGTYFLLILFISVIAIWQRIDYASSYQLFRFFISVNGLPPELLNMSASDWWYQNVNSIFAVSTDLGAITGMLAVVLFLQGIYFRKKQYSKLSTIALFLSLLLLIAGLCSGARIFILFIGSFVLYFAVSAWRKMPWFLPRLGLLSIAMAMLMIHFLPDATVSKLSRFAPVISAYHAGIPVVQENFSSEFQSFPMRREIWTRAIDVIRDKPLTGSSNALFRISNPEVEQGFELHNTHNVFLQAAVDAGLAGVALLLVLSIIIAIRLLRFPVSLSFYLATLTTLLVDNFTDHSLPWIIVCTYSLAVIRRLESTQEMAQVLHRFSSRQTLLRFRFRVISVLTLSSALLVYMIKLYQFYQADADTQLKSYLTILPSSVWQQNPLLIDPQLIRQTDTANQNKLTDLLSSPDRALCHYAYPNGMIVVANNNQENVQGNRIFSTEHFTVIRPANFFCDRELATPLQERHWISNQSQFLEATRRKTGPNSQITLRHPPFRVWSPLLTAAKGSYLYFDLSLTTLSQNAPLVSVSIINGVTGETDATKTVVVEHADYVSYKLDIPDNTLKFYVQARITDTKVNTSNAMLSSVRIRNFRMMSD